MKEPTQLGPALIGLAFSLLTVGCGRDGPTEPEPTAESPGVSQLVAGSASTFVVINTNDAGTGSLRQAFIDANVSGGTIAFAIPTTDPGFDGSVFTIQPASALPTLKRNITIDGTTQTAFTGNTNPAGPEVVLNGAAAGVASGIVFSGDDNAVKGLVLNGFSVGCGAVLSRLPFDPTPSRNQILDNYLGTDPTGTLAVPNNCGISMGGFGTPGAEARDNVIQNNLISGNTGLGISTCDIKGTLFADNLIGTDRTGTAALGNGTQGIFMQCTGALANVFTDNTIAFNGSDAIRSVPDLRFGNFHHENAIRGNSIFSNGGLGINLGPPPFGTVDAVTANDVCDADVTGSNFLQNFPVITSAASTGSSTTISGTLNSSPNQSFEVELFSNAAADPSGFGEGQTFLGVVAVNTDGTCDGSFNVVLPVGVGAGEFITATATDAAGNTSEFSGAVQVVSLVVQVEIDIKPGSDPNSINTKSKGTIPVAVLSTPDFDATTEVDKTSLSFGSTGDEASLAKCTKSNEDVNGDGLDDVVCHFRTQDTGFRQGDTEGVLRGQTWGGTPIEGRDAVRIVH